MASKFIENPKTITIIFLGSKSSGKSALIKNVFGLDTTKSDSSLLKAYQARIGDSRITVIDTQGLEGKKQVRELVKNARSKFDIDLFIYCLPINQDWGSKEVDLMRCLQKEFGKDIWQHCMVVLTFSNQAWDKIRRSHRSREMAITKYKEHVQEYAGNLEELLKAKKVSVVSILNTGPNCDHRSGQMLIVPAGLKIDEAVTAGIEYTITEEIFSSILGRQATGDKVTTDNWAAILGHLVLQQYRYSNRETFRERIKTSNRRLADYVTVLEGKKKGIEMSIQSTGDDKLTEEAIPIEETSL